MRRTPETAATARPNAARRQDRPRRRGPVGLVGSAVAVTGVLALGTAFSALPSAAQDDGHRSGGFSALSYNVAGLPEPLSGSEPDTNTPQISPKLNAYDVVLVQEDWIDPVPPLEGNNFHHDDLISQATHQYLSTPAEPPLGRDPRRPSALVGDGLNYLSRLPFGTVYRQMWPGCFGGADQSDGGAADCLSEKGFAVTRLQVAEGLTVDLYNLHAEAGSTPTDNEWSAADFQVLATFINTYSVNQSVIVAGDFNLSNDHEPDSTVFDTFIDAADLTDVCSVVTCDDDFRIDKFVFRNGPVVTLTPTTHNFEVDVFTRDPDGAPLSDHDALRVDWTWMAPSVADTPTVATVEFPATYQIPVSTTTTGGTGPTTTVAILPVVNPRFTG